MIMRAWQAGNSKLFETFDAQDFEDFLKQCYKARFPGLRNFMAGGKDGAIDLVHTDVSGNRTIFQAKIVVGDTATPMKSWKAEKKGLEESLLFRDGKLVGESQYGPWADPDRPVTRYIFCHTQRPIHCKSMDQLDMDNEALKADIEHFFRTTFAPRDRLRHLADIEVEVVSGDMLAFRCESDPALRFQWFGAIYHDIATPIGMAAGEKGFRAFLNDDKLPYYPRSAFKTEGGAAVPASYRDEEALLARLLDKTNEEPTLIIVGPGGIGKTRLAVELCRLAERDHGWAAFKLDPNATAANVTDLLRWTGNRVILWIDYLETQEGLGSILAAVRKRNRERECEVRVIATCRSSYYSYESGDLGDGEVLDLSPPPVLTPADWRESHQRRVFHHIFGRVARKAGLSPSHQDQFAESCHHRPVLAAFTLFLLETDRGIDLRALIKKKDFANWVLDRAHATLLSQKSMKKAELLRIMGQLLPLFPMRSAQFTTLAGLGNEFEPVLSMLRKDRLIEQTRPDRWEAAHDVIVDFILSRFLSTAADRTAAISQILDRAESCGAVHSAVISFQRIGVSETLPGKDWLALFSNRLSGNPALWAGVRASLLRTSLLDGDDRLRLLNDPAGRWSETIGNILYGRGYAALALVVAKWRRANPGKPDPAGWPSLHPYLDAAGFADDDDFCLVRALRYDFVRYRRRAEEVIAARSPTLDSHFLLVAWLEAGGELPAVQEKLRAWIDIDANALSDKSSFVFKALLGAASVAGPDVTRRTIEDLHPRLRSWLEHGAHALSDRAPFVFEAWLDAASVAGPDVARRTVEDLHPRLRSWLEHGDHALSGGACFVFKAWLDAASVAGPDVARRTVEDLHPRLRSWLEHGDHALSDGARFVFKAWLDAASVVGSERTEPALGYLVPKMQTWLNSMDHATRAEARFVFSGWLKAIGKSPWRERHLGAILPLLDVWLAVHQEDLTTDFIYRNLIAVGGKPNDPCWLAVEQRKSLIFNWLTRHCRRPEAVYLSKDIAKFGFLPAEAVDAVLTWVEHFPENEDALWRISQIRNHLSSKEQKRHAATALTAIANSYRLPDRFPSPRHRGDATARLFTTSHYLIHEPLFRPPLHALFIDAIRHPEMLNYAPPPKLSLQPKHLDFYHGVLTHTGVHPHPLNPSNPTDLAAMRRFIRYIDTVFQKSRADAAMNTAFERLRALIPD